MLLFSLYVNSTYADDIIVSTIHFSSGDPVEQDREQVVLKPSLELLRGDYRCRLYYRLIFYPG